MSSLSALQAAFKAHLLGGEPQIAAQVEDDERLGIALRLGIYRHAYQARLVEALASDYEALQTMLGEEAFADLGRAYVRAHPSTAFTLRWLGRHMSGFLARTPPYSEARYLSELAAFEWALAGAFDAADEPAAGETDAAAVPAEAWPALRIRLHPSVHLLECHWDVLALWRAFKEGSAMVPAQPLDEAGTLSIWREGLTTRFRSLLPEEAAALHAAAQGIPFAGLCETLLEWTPPEQAALRAATLLKGWLAAGMIAGLG